MNEENSLNPVRECPYCGHPIHFKDNYCSNCGARNNAWPGANAGAGPLAEAGGEPADGEFGVLIDTPDPSDMYFLPIEDDEWEEKEDD